MSCNDMLTRLLLLGGGCGIGVLLAWPPLKVVSLLRPHLVCIYDSHHIIHIVYREKKDAEAFTLISAHYQNWKRFASTLSRWGKPQSVEYHFKIYDMLPMHISTFTFVPLRDKLRSNKHLRAVTHTI